MALSVFWNGQENPYARLRLSQSKEESSDFFSIVSAGLVRLTYGLAEEIVLAEPANKKADALVKGTPASSVAFCYGTSFV
ncbi:MAG: hypothetical protein ACJAZO_002421 [Myxococcota bacterium]|jgi:hypothetical protein